jgi:hypothetical protein
MELSDRLINFLERRPTALALPARSSVRMGLRKNDDRRKPLGMQPDRVGQRAGGGPNSIGAVVASAM